MKFISKLLTEPLVQFLVLGAFVVFVNRYVLGNTDDPRRIVFDDARYREIVEIFNDGQGRKPTEAEIEELIVQWTQNEVLYREGLLMGLDKGDEMIRQRLILKMRNILFNNLVTELPPEEELRAWFEENRAAYDRPALFDFEQFRLPDADADASSALADELGSGPHPAEFQREHRAYSGRPAINFETAFGADDARRLVDSPDGRWLAVDSEYGWHLARITARVPGEPADFDAVRSAVAQDWIKVMEQKDLNDALMAIVEEYEFSYEVTKDAVEGTLLATDATALDVPR